MFMNSVHFFFWENITTLSCDNISAGFIDTTAIGTDLQHLVSKPAWLLRLPNRWKWTIFLMFRSNLFCNHCSFVGQRRTGPWLSLGFFLHSITWWSFGSLPLLPCFWLAYLGTFNIQQYHWSVLHYFHVITVKLLWYNLYCKKCYINKC